MPVTAGTQVAHDLPVPQDRLVVIEQRLGVGQTELQQALVQPGVLFAQHRVAPDEIGFGGFHGKAQPGLQHVILAGDVMAEMAKGLFDPAAVHAVHPAERQPMVLPGLGQHLEHMSRHLGADIELPSQFADIGHPVRPGEAHADLDLLRHAKRMRRVREIGGRDRAQQIARFRPHHGQYTLTGGDIGHHHPRVADVAAQPGLIGQTGQGRGDDQPGGLGQAGDGHIRLDPAAAVEELGIDDPAHRYGYVIAADAVEEGLGIRPFDPQLAKAGHVIHADAGAQGHVFLRHVVEPGLAFPAKGIGRILARAPVPVRPFPARQFAKHRAALGQRTVERRATQPPCAGLLPVGPVIGIEQAQRLGHTGGEIRLVALRRVHPGNVHIAQIERFFTRVHPGGQCHARAARRLDADGVEPGGHPDIVHLGRLAQQISVVGGKAFGAVEEGVDAHRAQHRHPVHRRLEDRLEMVEILGQLVEFKAFGNAVQRPGLGDGLERAQHHLAGVFLVIGAFIRHAQDGQGGQAGDRLGHDIEMLAGLQGDVGVQHPPDVPAPHARTVDDMVAGDRAGAFGRLVLDLSDAESLAGDAGDAGILEHLRAALAGALGEGKADIGGIALAVLGQPDAALDAVEVQMRIARADVVRADLRHLDAKGAGHGGGAFEFFVPFVGQGGGDAADPAKAGGDAGFLFEVPVEFLRVFGEPRHPGRGAQLGNETGRVPGGARGQALAFQQDNICPAELGQVIGHRGADDAAADDDGAGVSGDRCHGCGSAAK